jgi:alginate O-acetyltransferase complex protein AlgI
MQFLSIEFLLFFAVTAIMFRVCPHRWHAHFLLVVSYAFYCTWSTTMGAVLLLLTMLCYYAGLAVERGRGTKWASQLIVATIAALVLCLVFFKSAHFLFAGQSLLIQLGVSYYTFRLISYLLDVHWGKMQAARTFVPFAAYVAFFPHMIAGPIQRALSFLPQLESQGEARDRTVEGLARVLLGYFKKAVVADNLALFVNYAYQHLHSSSSVPNLVAFYIYPLQLYTDFSALTDIAVGVALAFGIESPENFDAPFSAINISDFWRRWHMSLTSWLRDYVFIPLRMETRNWGDLGLAFSLSVNMVLIGLWHGFALTFLVFGILHAIFLSADVLTSTRRKKYYKGNVRVAKLASVFGPVLTYHMVALGNTLFRSPSLAVAWQVLAGFGSGFSQASNAFSSIVAPPAHRAWIAFPAFALTEIADTIRRRNGLQLPETVPSWARWSTCVCIAACFVFLALLFLARNSETNPFVYAFF